MELSDGQEPMILLKCRDCNKVVGEIGGGSKLIKGLVCLCKECALPKKSPEMPDFLKDLMGGKRYK